MAKRNPSPISEAVPEKRIRYFNGNDSHCSASESIISRKRVSNAEIYDLRDLKRLRPNNKNEEYFDQEYFKISVPTESTLIRRPLYDPTIPNGLAIVPYVQQLYYPQFPVSRCTIEILDSDEEEEDAETKSNEEKMDVEI